MATVFRVGKQSHSMLKGEHVLKHYCNPNNSWYSTSSHNLMVYIPMELSLEITLLVTAKSRHFASSHGDYLGGVVELAAIGMKTQAG